MMCDPATLTMLSAIGTGVGAVTSAVGAIASGQSQSAAADAQAELFRRQAEREREIAALTASRQDKENTALAARQRALLSAQGRDISTGSALLLQTDLAEQAEFERLLTIAGGEAQAGVSETQAALARAEGKTATTSSLFRAGGTLLGGASDVAELFG